jgi:hypothetical protein
VQQFWHGVQPIAPKACPIEDLKCSRPRRITASQTIRCCATIAMDSIYLPKREGGATTQAAIQPT